MAKMVIVACRGDKEWLLGLKEFAAQEGRRIGRVVHMGDLIREAVDQAYGDKIGPGNDDDDVSARNAASNSAARNRKAQAS